MFRKLGHQGDKKYEPTLCPVVLDIPCGGIDVCGIDQCLLDLCGVDACGLDNACLIDL